MCIYPTFHVSRIKPVQESTLVPAAPRPPLRCLIDGGPPTPFGTCCASATEEGTYSTWSTRRDMVQRKDPRSPAHHILELGLSRIPSAAPDQPTRTAAAHGNGCQRPLPAPSFESLELEELSSDSEDSLPQTPSTILAEDRIWSGSQEF